MYTRFGWSIGFAIVGILISQLTRGSTLAGEFKTYQSGSNTVEIRTYAAPSAGETDLPAAWLQDSWNTETEMRWDLAAVLALFSQQVYADDEETLDYLVRGMGFTKWVAVRNPNQSMVGHVLSQGDVAVVAFRGTNPTELYDWLTNLDVLFVTTAHGRFHRGFTAAYNSLRSDVSSFLDQAQPKRIWITGHSLGGAMALSCAVDLAVVKSMQPSVVTFGQPRYADANGARWIDSMFRGHYVRFVHGSDIVPRVPFTVPWLFPYSHAGRFVAITDNGFLPASSINATMAKASSACQHCGQLSVVKEPIYQPIEEAAPLSEAEFRHMLAGAAVQMPVSQEQGHACQTMQLQIMPQAISDHSMDAYLTVVRRYRDSQKQTAR
ncbi:MAG: lipase family protein [Aureliella sp.]